MQGCWNGALFVAFIALSFVTSGTANDAEEPLTTSSRAPSSPTGVQAPDPDRVAALLQAALLKSLFDWSSVDDTDEGDDGDTAASEAQPDALAAQLQQVLDVAAFLLRTPKGCHGGSETGDSNRPDHSVTCPAPAPELLQGRTSAFLSSTLRTYPRGPTSRADLLAWATAANHFLDEHHRLQRLQRTAASQAADAGAAAPAVRPGAEAPDSGAARPAAGAVGGKSSTGKPQQKPEPQKPRPPNPVAPPSTSTRSQLPSGGSAKPAAGSKPARRRLRVTGQEDSRAGLQPVGVAGPKTRTADPWVIADSELLVTHRTLPKSSGATAGGLPLVRRVLMAQLLMVWEKQQASQLRDMPDVAVQLARLIIRLYRTHVDSVVDRAALEYFHISKAGGTSWIAAADANGCTMSRGKASRVPEFDDDCRWFDPAVLLRLGFNETTTARMLVCPRYGMVGRRGPVRDCARRLEHTRQRGLQYINNEYTLHGGLQDMYGTHICPQFVTVATIREPRERLLSNVRYILVQLKRDRSMDPRLFQETFCNRSGADWEVFAPPVADNYNIRTLVGERAFHTPLYGIGEAHEALAKQLLIQFDLILDLNAGDADAALLMRKGLGWNHTLADVHIWASEKLAKRYHLDFTTCALGDFEPLLERQVYDQRWYSFGRALSRLDQLFLGAAAHLGLQPWPEDWEERVLGPPPGDGIVRADCGLVGLVPPLRGTAPSPSSRRSS